MMRAAKEVEAAHLRKKKAILDEGNIAEAKISEATGVIGDKTGEELHPQLRLAARRYSVGMH